MLVWITTGMFVFARLAGLFMTMPVISTQGVPRHVSVLGAMALTLVLVPVVPATPGAPTLALLVLGMTGDVVLGLLLGLIVNAVFISFTIASEVMSMQMGFAMATLFDPVLKSMDGPIGVLGNWLAGVVFLGMGLHLTCIGILADSFAVLPPGRVPGIFGGIDLLLEAMTTTIVLGMQLAGPVLALVWLVQVFVMVLTKIAPRMNIYFSVGMMLTNGAGLMLLALSYHIRKEDLGTILRIARMPRPHDLNDVSTAAITSAFLLSELKTAFIIAVKVYLPFLMLDIVVASILLGMGMMVLPPVVISLPFKLLMFVLMDGWALLVTSMVESIR